MSADGLSQPDSFAPAFRGFGVRLSLFYATYFLLIGVLAPFWPLFLAGRGLDAGEIGLLLGATLWGRMVAGPLTALVVDGTGNPRLVIMLSALAACLTTSLVYVAAARKVRLTSVSSVVEGDMDGHAVSHLGWGLNPQARWYNIALNGDAPERSHAGARTFPGNFLFSTGPNTQGGGKRATKGHYDVPMRDCTVLLDNAAVIERGRIVDPVQIVAREQR